MSNKLRAGQFPVLQRGINDNLFVRHQQSMPERIELPSGEKAETGYVKVTNGQKIDIYALCQNDGKSKTLSIRSLVYIDEGDNLCVHEIKKMAPIELGDPAYVSKTGAKITVGYVSKLCGLRWGFTLHLNPVTGEFDVETDIESPVVGIKIQFS